VSRRGATIDRVADYDLVVLGAGATGLGAARAGRAGGRRVALVEPDRPGGDCTHYGCVPSKTLIETARRLAAARDGGSRGLRASVEVDFAAVTRHVQSVIAEVERDESPALLARQGIDLLVGAGRFLDPTTIEVTVPDGTPRRVHAERVVLATGAKAAVPDLPGLAGTPYLTNETVFSLTEQPAHLLVLGGGPIGVELAQAYRRLGSAVTVVERASRLLEHDEPEAGRVVRAALERDGVGVCTDSAVRAVSPGPTLHLADGSTVRGSHLLIAVGRTPRTADLGLAAAGVSTDERGAVVVDDYLRTTAPGVLAAGDVASRLQFTHVGDEQGRLAAANAFAPAHRPGLLGGRRAWDASVVPWVTYTEPEVAHVGLTEAAAHARYGEAALVTYVANSTSDRARAAGATEGFVKMIAAPRRVLRAKPFLRLVGMTAVGPVAGELIAQGALAMRTGMFVGRIAQTIHAYPTWSLSTRLAAAQFYGQYGGRTARPARPG